MVQVPETNTSLGRGYYRSAIEAIAEPLSSDLIMAVQDLNRLGFSFKEIATQSGADPFFLSAAYDICKLPDPLSEQGSMIHPSTKSQSASTNTTEQGTARSAASLSKLGSLSASLPTSLPASLPASLSAPAGQDVQSNQIMIPSPVIGHSTKRIKFGSNRWSSNLSLELSDDDDCDDEAADSMNSNHQKAQVHSPTRSVEELISRERAQLLKAKLEEIEKMKQMLRQAETVQSEQQYTPEVDSIVSSSNDITNSASMGIDEKLEELGIIEERLEEKLEAKLEEEKEEKLEQKLQSRPEGQGESETTSGGDPSKEPVIINESPQSTKTITPSYAPKPSSQSPSDSIAALAPPVTVVEMVDFTETDPEDTESKDGDRNTPVDLTESDFDVKPLFEHSDELGHEPTVGPSEPSHKPTAQFAKEHADEIVDNSTSKPADVQTPHLGPYRPYQSPLRVFNSFKFSPMFLDCVGSNGYRSLAYSGLSNNSDKPFCTNQLDGSNCNDPNCSNVHMKDFEASETQMVLTFIDDAHLAFKAKTDGKGGGSVTSFKKTLVKMLSQGSSFEDIIATVLEFKRKRDGPTKFLDWRSFETVSRT